MLGPDWSGLTAVFRVYNVVVHRNLPFITTPRQAYVIVYGSGTGKDSLLHSKHWLFTKGSQLASLQQSTSVAAAVAGRIKARRSSKLAH